MSAVSGNSICPPISGKYFDLSIIILVIIIRLVSFPLSGNLGLAPNPFDERIEIVVPPIDILPHELVRVGRRARVTASTADKQLAIISGRAGYPARRILGVEGG